MAAKGWGQTNMQDTLDQFEEDLSGNAAFFQFKDGDNEVRICPSAADERLPFDKRAQHWRVGPHDKIFNCPRARDEHASCFLCDKVSELKKSDDKADVDKGEDLFAKRVWLYRIIDPQNVRKGVQVMNVGIKTHKQIAKLMRDKDWGDITDPVEGINIVIEKTGSGQFGTEYVVRPKPKPSNVLKILEECEPPDIVALCEPATNAQMKAAWNDDEAEAGPAPEQAKSSRRNVDDDEPQPRRARDEEPDDDEPQPRRARDEEPEGEEPSAKRRREDPDDAEPRRGRTEDPEAPRGRHLSTRSRED